MRIAPIPPESVVRKGDLPGLVLRVRSDDGDLKVGPAEVAGRSGRQAKEGTRLSDLDGAVRNNFELVVLGGHQSAAGAW
jgi:hypothetical protein